MNRTRPNPEGAHHVPGNRIAKIIYLGLSTIVFALGCWMAGEPLYPMFFGQRAEAKVAEIRLAIPGEPEKSFKYRRPYKPHANPRAVYSHYVSVPVNGKNELFRIGLDSRRVPVEFYNVNDRVSVAYRPSDPHRIAFAYRDTRTWGLGGMFFALGGAMLATAIPMLLAVGKPIRIDPEISTEPIDSFQI